MKSINSVKLIAHDSVDLDRLSYSNGDIVYDITNATIRLMDGANLGGRKLATQPYVGTAISTALGPYATTTSVGTAISTALTSYATTTSVGTAISTALTSYATTASVTTALSSYSTTASVTTALSSYSTTASMNSAISTGSVASATRLTTARKINNINFDGSADITITASAGTLTGTTLSSGVTGSSLTTVGTLNALEVAGNIQADSNVVISTVPTLTTHATNKKYVDNKALAMSIALS